MAIKRAKKEEVSLDALPEKLDGMLKIGFTASCLEKRFKEEGKEVRTEIKEYLEENEDGFEVELSKSFKTEYGSVNMKVRNNYDIDKDAVLELIEAGTVTIETIVHMATLSAEKLKAAIGEAAFTKISEHKPTEFLELKANSGFKEMIAEEFEVEEKPLFVPPAKIKPTKVKTKSDKDSAKDSLAKIKKAKSKKKSVDSDLDAILNK